MKCLSARGLDEKRLIKALRAYKTLFRKQKIKDFYFEVDGKCVSWEIYEPYKISRRRPARKVIQEDEIFSLKVYFTP